MELLICFVFQAAPLESVMRANIWKWVKYECFNRNLMDQRGNKGEICIYTCVWPLLMPVGKQACLPASADYSNILNKKKSIHAQRLPWH